MRRWVKVVLVLLVVLVVVLVLNSIAVTNQTKDAKVNVDGAELVETSNGTIQVLEEGNPEGSPIVLIHCYGGSMQWFQKLAPILGQDHRVIRVDLLGFGGSEKPSAGYEITDQANAVTEALAGMDVSGATVVGHSLGGSVATAIAEQSPKLATRVVILDQAVDSDLEHLSFTDRFVYAPLLGPAIHRIGDIGPSALVRKQYERAFAPGFNMASGFENPDQVVDDFREMTYTAFKKASDADDDYTDARPLDERLGAIAVPLLVMFGAEDQVYDDPTEAIAPYRDIPGAQTQIIDGVGHSPNVEAPEETANLIEAFIVRVTAAERAQRRAEAKAEAAARAKARAKRRAAATAAKKKKKKKAAAAAKKAAESKKPAPAAKKTP